MDPVSREEPTEILLTKTTNYIMRLNKKMKTILPLAAFAGLALTASSAHAALTVTSYTYDAAGVPVQTGNALEDPLFSKLTDGIYPDSTWSDGTNVGWKDGTTGQLKPGITFDLGGQFDLTTIDVWTEEQFSAGGTESVTISTSTDGSTWSLTTVADTLAWVDQGAIEGNGIDYGNKVTIDVSSLPTGQFIKMDFVEPSQWMMLTEIDFEGTAVPEPSTTALLGLGGLALILRRRK
jgi:hypothetical protein